MTSHYYDAITGEPKYTVIGSNGKERNTTVADARKLNLVPSYSTIVSLLNKEGINIWQQDQLLEAAMEWPYDGEWSDAEEYEKYENEDFIKQWKKDVKDIAGKLGRQGRERGTMVHDALEKCYKGEGLDLNLHKLIMPVLELVDETFGLASTDWQAETSFAHNGYGGKVDLHSRSDHGIVIDFKTKNETDIKKLKPYPNDVMQHAAYREGLGIPHAKCYSLFINVNEKFPWLVLHEWKEEEIQRAGRMFNLLKEFWYLQHKLEMR